MILSNTQTTLYKQIKIPLDSSVILQEEEKASWQTLEDASTYDAMPLSHKHMTNAALIIFTSRDVQGAEHG